MRPSLCCLLLAAGCAASDEAAGAEYMDEPFPPWSCDTDEMSGTGQPCGTSGTAAATCEGTQDCGDEVCAASFNGDIGPFECQSSCIDAMDDYRWCSDAAACCDADAICDRGYCIAPDGIETTTGSETTDASTSSAESSESGTGTESESSGTTDTGTGTSTGTGTGETGGSSGA